MIWMGSEDHPANYYTKVYLDVITTTQVVTLDEQM
jgi:hypothetical protein